MVTQQWQLLLPLPGPRGTTFGVAQLLTPSDFLSSRNHVGLSKRRPYSPRGGGHGLPGACCSSSLTSLAPVLALNSEAEAYRRKGR